MSITGETTRVLFSDIDVSRGSNHPKKIYFLSFCTNYCLILSLNIWVFNFGTKNVKEKVFFFCKFRFWDMKSLPTNRTFTMGI